MKTRTRKKEEKEINFWPRCCIKNEKVSCFYFSFAYDSGHPYGMDYAKEITENENIYVDFNAIVGWAQKEGIVDKQFR